MLRNTPLLKPGFTLALKLAVTGSILYYLFTLIPFPEVLQAISKLSVP